MHAAYAASSSAASATGTLNMLCKKDPAWAGTPFMEVLYKNVTNEPNIKTG
jgi:hypothetical protein